jgi:CRISPR-associated protein Csx14
MASVLVATLGAEPQIVLLAAAALARQGAPVDQVVVVHTLPTRPPISVSLPAVQAAFAAQPSSPPLTLVTTPAVDVLTQAELDLFATILFHTLQGFVTQRVRVHLLLAGGRKSMAMVGLSVAQLLLGPEDRVWHLYSDEALRRSGRAALADGDEVTLIPIPLAPPALAAPVYTPVARAASPATARATLADEQQRRLAHFLRHELTSAEREVATLIAGEVLTVTEIAARLGKRRKTVTNQLTVIYSKLESFFGLTPDMGTKREFLRWVVGEGGDGS